MTKRAWGWLAQHFIREGGMAIDGRTVLLPDGVIGFFPVFKTKKAARLEYGPNVVLLEVEQAPPHPHRLLKGNAMRKLLTDEELARYNDQLVKTVELSDLHCVAAMYDSHQAALVRIEELGAEVKRFGDRDCQATIRLCYNNDDNPFAKETLKIVDVGVSDNIYVVESEVFKQAQAENERLKSTVDKLKTAMNVAIGNLSSNYMDVDVQTKANQMVMARSMLELALHEAAESKRAQDAEQAKEAEDDITND